MNKLAQELNKKLKNTTAFNQLSSYGKRIYFPVNGIVAQSKEAGQKAALHNATIGMAVHNGKAIMVPEIKSHFSILKENEIVSYSNSHGELELRDLWEKEIYRKNPSLGKTVISKPIVVPGLTGGVSQVAKLFVERGDNVISPDMYWENYDLIFEEVCEAKLRKYKFYDKNKNFNIAELEKAILKYHNNKKVTIILNFPNNPTGYSPTKEDAENLKNSLLNFAKQGFKITAIIDDAYFGLFYEDNIYKESLFSILAKLHKNILAIKIDGATKEHFVWGFRIGFVTFASPDLDKEKLSVLENKLAGSCRAYFSNCSKVAQSILIQALKNGTYEKNRNEFDVILKKRYLKVKEILSKRVTGLKLTALNFNSGYFMCFKFDGNSEILRKNLLEEFKIGTISVQDKFLRVAFSAIDIDKLDSLYSKIFIMADKL